MIDCPFEQQPDGTFKCPQCGWSYHKKARRNCPKAREAMIAEFDRLMAAGDEDAADEVANRLLCWERCKASKGRQCGKAKAADS